MQTYPRSRHVPAFRPCVRGTSVRLVLALVWSSVARVTSRNEFRLDEAGGEHAWGVFFTGLFVAGRLGIDDRD